MRIDQLEAKTKVINLVAIIESLGEETKTPNDVPVQEGILSDESGQVKFTLWDDQVGQFKVGDKISMTTGWCKSFENELQVSTGKFGKISKVPKTPDEE